jgi:hypothetical protein
MYHLLRSTSDQGVQGVGFGVQGLSPSPFLSLSLSLSLSLLLSLSLSLSLVQGLGLWIDHPAKEHTGSSIMGVAP